ncbi:MAG: hypothetical protein OXC91_11645 [Rhodobacteraceae bacterium]|nr:hypothetical protein [Paracoccaceae bacterium]
MTQSNRICSLWIDGPLRLVDRVCLTSWVANGMDVTLYTYGSVDNVPKGIAIADGATILPLELADRMRSARHPEADPPFIAFSDFFRIECQRLGCGMWLDADVLLFRPFTYDTGRVFLVRENRFRLGYSTLYLPADNPMCTDYVRLRESSDLMPGWLGFKRRVLKPFVFRVAGIPWSPIDLGLTVYANDGFSRLARRYGYWSQTRSRETFYSWTGKRLYRMFEVVDYQPILDNENCLGLHVHKKGDYILK